MNKKGLPHCKTVLGLLIFGFMALTSTCSSTPKAVEEATITFDSSTLQGVSKITDDRLRKDKLSISPDGSKLLYCESEVQDLSVGLYTEDFKIVLIRNIGSGTKTPLITDSSFYPAWFDDNATFVYVSFESGATKLVKTGISGGGKTYITRNPVGDDKNKDVNPSVHGQTILIDTIINDKRQIVSLNASGTDVTIICEGRSASWHPSGKKFVFIRDVPNPDQKTGGKRGAVYEMDIGTYQATELYVDRENKDCSSPSYSPDGEYILFNRGSDVQIRTNTEGRVYDKKGNVINTSRTTVRGEVAKWHLFYMNSGGGPVSQITSGDVNVFSPVWGSNNNIYFISNAGGATEIWRARINLGNKATASEVEPVPDTGPSKESVPDGDEETILRIRGFYEEVFCFIGFGAYTIHLVYGV